MSWIAYVGVAVLTAVLSLLGAGSVAALAVDWYNISSFEGGSGFFVVGMALVGAVAGFVIGLIATGVTAKRPHPSFVKAAGTAAGTVAIILAAVAGASWMLADIPPQIDGEELFLLTELRWPASGAPAPAEMTGIPNVRLGALRGSTARRMESGPRFVDAARQEDGRWIVPGAVAIFTSRGRRLLDFATGEKSSVGFLLPLPKYPGKEHMEWSEWLPAARPGDPPLPDQFTYRFKVIRQSDPVRTETIGPFAVDTIATYFYYVDEDSPLAAHATFRLSYKGQPVPRIFEVQTVSVVAGARPALLATTTEAAAGSACLLIVDDGAAPRVQRMIGCATPLTVAMLTSDSKLFEAAQAQEPAPGWIDRLSFTRPGLFHLGSAILDTRELTATSFTSPEDPRPDQGVPPLDLSPDQRSFVWLAQGDDEHPRLGVTNWRTGASYILPLDRARMRYNTAAALDPAWVQHHFAWNSGDKNGKVLVERGGLRSLGSSWRSRARQAGRLPGLHVASGWRAASCGGPRHPGERGWRRTHA
ncbi:MAG: hypothetical protein ABIS06_04395 [Vicinamibacterales bacterium]